MRNSCKTGFGSESVVAKLESSIYYEMNEQTFLTALTLRRYRGVSGGMQILTLSRFPHLDIWKVRTTLTVLYSIQEKRADQKPT